MASSALAQPKIPNKNPTTGYFGWSVRRQPQSRWGTVRPPCTAWRPGARRDSLSYPRRWSCGGGGGGWDRPGVARRLAGEYPAGARDLEQALGIYRDLGDRLGQANALSSLGVARRMTGAPAGDRA